jgi:addiction module HigA family antidote
MDNRIDIIKGIHPGKFIERELNKRKLTQRNLADKTGIRYQTINAIIAERRNLTTGQALKIDIALGFEEGFHAILQTHFDIKRLKDKALEESFKNAPHIRKSLFWDVDFDKINWGKYKNAVIKRVFERGSEKEIEEISKYYKLST